MLIVISPAKTLDYETPLPSVRATQPRLLDDSAELVERARELSPPSVPCDYWWCAARRHTVLSLCHRSAARRPSRQGRDYPDRRRR